MGNRTFGKRANSPDSSNETLRLPDRRDSQSPTIQEFRDDMRRLTDTTNPLSFEDFKDRHVGTQDRGDPLHSLARDARNGNKKKPIH